MPQFDDNLTAVCVDEPGRTGFSGGMKSVGNRVGGGLRKGASGGAGMAKEFLAFISRGNVVDLAVGIIIGTAFTAIVTSLVTDMITPIIGLALGGNLATVIAVIRCPKNNTDCDKASYKTPAQATSAGAVYIGWGRFLDTIISFVIISLVVFALIKALSVVYRKKKEVEAAKHFTCDQCLEDVKIGAVRCPHCLNEFPSTTVEGMLADAKMS